MFFWPQKTARRRWGERIRSVIYRMLEALFQDRPEALSIERGSRDNVGGDYREGIRTI